MKNKDGYNALYVALFSEGLIFSSKNKKHYNSFTLLVKECILPNIGGEFGIGGLFNNERKIQRKIYKRWTKLSPALKTAVESLQGHPRQPPILHAAILAKAPVPIIQDIITKFEYSVLKTDSLNRYPLAVALEVGLHWNWGLQHVAEATVVAQQQSKSIIMFAAARYGLKWRHRMKEIAEVDVDEVLNGFDSSTGLRAFMVAAMGDYHDLSGIYGMMRISPETRNAV